MRALLDTHALLWWLADDPGLSAAATRTLTDTENRIFVSAASAWEIATKLRLGKLPTAANLMPEFAAIVAREGFDGLPISIEHAVRAGMLPGTHKDPFDRMLIAQAQAENVSIVSNEALFDWYGVSRIW